MKSPYSSKEIQRPETDAQPVQAIMPEKYERCGFCNSKLVFSHDLNLAYLEVIETGRCPGCGVAMHPKKFTLH